MSNASEYRSARGGSRNHCQRNFAGCRERRAGRQQTMRACYPWIDRVRRRYNFDPANNTELLKAEQRFNELTGLGFTAAVRTAAGEPHLIRRFDPTAKETLFFP